MIAPIVGYREVFNQSHIFQDNKVWLYIIWSTCMYGCLLNSCDWGAGERLRFNMISLDFADLTTQLSGRDEASNQLNSELQNLKSQLAGMIFVKNLWNSRIFLNLISAQTLKDTSLQIYWYIGPYRLYMYQFFWFLKILAHSFLVNYL